MVEKIVYAVLLPPALWLWYQAVVWMVGKVPENIIGLVAPAIMGLGVVLILVDRRQRRARAARRGVERRGQDTLSGGS